MRGHGVNALLAAALLAVSACGSERPAALPPTPPKATAQPTTVRTEPPPRASVVARRARGATKEQALSALVLSVKTALVGRPWAIYASQWQPNLSPEMLRWHSETEVEAKLDASAVERWLAGFEGLELQPDAPPPFREPLLLALTAERAYLACQQRQALLAQPCSMLPPTEQRGAVASALSKLVLEPDWPDGVPVDAEGRALWPARIRAWERTEQGLHVLEGVPLRVEWCVPEYAAAPRIVRSDATGLVQLPMLELWQRMGVKVASSQLLGPLAEVWPGKTLELQTRALERSRLAAVVVERAGGRKANTSVMVPVLLGELAAHWAREPAALSDELSHSITSAQALMDAELRARVAEATQGQVDYVLLVHGDSEFASRMGTGRTWYEARANVELVELWTGKVVEHFSLEHAEAGIGDARADEAARTGLAMKIVERLSGS